jgi:adenosylhomocysteine nucleosidase
MLLRWIVDQYLRDAAQNKLREVVSDIAAPKGPTAPPPQAIEPHSKTRTLPVVADGATPAQFLPCHTAFIFALGIESGGLTDLLTGAETSQHPHGVERAGKLGSREVAIIESGVGQRAAARATAEAIKFYQPKWVISAGFAGGMHESLRRGHILMADAITNLAGEQIATNLPLDPATLAASKGLHFGRLLTVDSIIRHPAERHRLAAEHSALACDMETYAVAAACRERNTQFLSVRIISDAVDDELPPEIEHLLKQRSLAGKLGAAAGALFKRLGAAKDLWKLREDALKASDRLAKFLAGVVAQLPTSDK